MAGPNSAGGSSSVRKMTQSSANGAGPKTVLPVGSSKRAELTERDIDILTWITRHGVVTTEQIATKFFPGTSGFQDSQHDTTKDLVIQG